MPPFTSGTCKPNGDLETALEGDQGTIYAIEMCADNIWIDICKISCIWKHCKFFQGGINLEVQIMDASKFMVL